MSDSTPRLGLPYILQSQAQKEVSHNEALNLLDAVVHACVRDRDLAAPPADPGQGDCWLVAVGASGAWTGHTGQIAAWYGSWVFLPGREGLAVWVADEDLLLRHDGVAWIEAADGLNAARLDRAQTFTRAQRGAYVALADAATVTPDFSLANRFRLTLGGNRAMATPTNLAPGQGGVLKLVQDAAGSRTLSWSNAWKFAGGAAPTLSTAPNAVDLVGYEVEDDGATISAWLCVKGRA